MNTDLSVQDLRKLASSMQNNRLLTLVFPQGDAPYKILLANRLEGEESLSRDFRFIIEILSDNAKLDSKEFIGKLVSVKLLRNDGSSGISTAISSCFGWSKAMAGSFFTKPNWHRGFAT